MNNIKEFLTSDHRACDEIFAQLEDAMTKAPETAEEVFNKFNASLQNHFKMEEEVMFPAFEEKTGMRQGPTQIMRTEHVQMRALVEKIQEAISAKDTEKFYGLSETLMILMQQHNMKEEQMLYTMAQQHLGDEAGSIIEKMKIV